MPARWQSSQRPLFVRTVWVGGRRHAILSRDDPLLRLPRPASTAAASDTASETSTCCQLEDCLIKLRLALQPDSYQGTYKETIFPIRHGTVEASHCFDHSDSDSLYEEELPPQRLPLLGQYPKVYSFDVGEPSPYMPELQLNPLSERVLQWLDLSRKGKRLNTAVGLQRISEPSKERRKTSTTDMRKPHISRRELPTRSLSVDVLADMKLSARGLDTHRNHRKPQVVVVSASSKPSTHEEYPLKKPTEEPPVIQTFESPRLLRPLGSWPPQQAPNRPQLHIFMPPLEDECKMDSESESTVGDAA